VLKHKEISQLINFLKTAKERVSKLPDPNNIVAEKLRNINQLLNQAYLEEWERKYKQAYEINQSAAILLEDGKTELALDKYK
jgi:phage regulator Rha-like protein